MKQYTTPEQTAKLMELGFEKPKGGISKRVSYFDDRLNRKCRYEISKFNYSIGELISFLPDDGVSDKRLEFDGYHWFVDWDSFGKIRQTMGVELVDALYDMVIQIKKGGRDMKLEDLVLKQTCECCPEQYDVIYNGGRIGYIRYRSGLFTCQPVIENKTQYHFLVYECIDDWHLTLYDDNREDLLLESKKRLVKFWNNFDGVEL